MVAMLWQLACVSTLALGTALTAAAPQPIYPTASSTVAAVLPSADAAVPAPMEYFDSNSVGYVKRAANTKKRTTSTTLRSSSTPVVVPTAASSTAVPVTVPSSSAEAITWSVSSSEPPITSSSTSAALSATAFPGSFPRPDCSCGYIMTEHDDAYYPLGIVVDFARVSSIDEFPSLGLYIQNGRIGGVNRDDGVTACYSTPDNVRLVDGVMELVVPGGQQMGGIVTGAEVRSIDKMTSGHLTMSAQLSPTHGTCQALFTYIDEEGYPSAGDEQDIEVLGQSIDDGMILTVYNPETYHTQSLGDVIPFPAPPTVAQHNYTIFWPPASTSPRQTSYFFDGQHIKTFDRFTSVNPSGGYINHWSNGQLSFTQGPPVEDAVMRVSGLAWYYSTLEVPGLPAGCSMEEVCRV